MKILHFIAYLILPIVVANNISYTMEDKSLQMKYFDLDSNDNNQKMETQQAQMKYFDLDSNDNNQKMETQQEIENLQKQADEKKDAIKQYLQKLQNDTVLKYGVDKYFDVLIDKELYCGETNIHSSVLDLKMLFDEIDTLGYDASLLTEQLFALVNIGTMFQLSRCYYNYTKTINYKTNSMWEQCRDIFNGLQIHYNKEEITQDDSISKLIYDKIFTQNKFQTVREAILKIDLRTCSEKFLLGCIHLIYQYFVLKDKISEAKRKLDQLK